MRLPIPIESDQSRDQAFTAVSTLLSLVDGQSSWRQQHDSECKWKCWFLQVSMCIDPSQDSASILSSTLKEKCQSFRLLAVRCKR
ncbi:hypothetical protein AAHA92_09403 [Salvia divinorum]|uniref:Uncharacterized protein n=1 Tax=Salvia divinorum TaxID=28513 RepID=A0ABD1HRE6_SALDI